ERAGKPEPSKPYEAELASGASGAVLKAKELSLADAVDRRKNGENVVICGSQLKENRRLAEIIESKVGPCERHDPHDAHARRAALPHFQQQERSRPGHTFYETPRRKARKKR